MDPARAAPTERVGLIARTALALTAFTERWLPDAFIFALLATLAVVVAAKIATSSPAAQVVDAWGHGFWELIPFTMQMALIIITGHVLATSPPMGRLIRAVASWPRSPRAAVALVTLFALATAWFNWGFSLSSARCSDARWRGVFRAWTIVRSPPLAFWAQAASGRRA